MKKERIRPTFSYAPLYGDTLWPWFRCFIAIWFGLIFSYGFSLWFEAASVSIVAPAYSFGLLRFWVFYIPVFGFFLQKFYSDYTGDGIWTPGPCYVSYLRSNFRDFL